jgi:uncharacterized protein (TIGR00369 family)
MEMNLRSLTHGSSGKRKPMQSPIASKTYGTVSADRQKEMSGLEFVQGLVDGTLPLNTIAKTLGYDVTEAANGRVVVIAEPNDIHLNPAGTVHGGLAATLLDSCMGLAVQSTLEKGVGQTTLEFKISLLRPITPETGLIKGGRHGAKPRSPRRHRRGTGDGWQRALARPWHDNVPYFSELMAPFLTKMVMSENRETSRPEWIRIA